MRWRTEKARPRRVSGLPAMRLQPSARGGWHTEGEGTAPASQVISQHLSALHSAGATFAGALGGSSNEISVHASGSSTMREARELTRRVVGVSLCRCRVSRLAVSVSTVTGQVYLYTLFYATGLQRSRGLRPCRRGYTQGYSVCNVCSGVCSVYECQRDLSGRVCTMQTTNSLDLQ